MDKQLPYHTTVAMVSITEGSIVPSDLDISPSLIEYRYQQRKEIRVNISNITTRTGTADDKECRWFFTSSYIDGGMRRYLCLNGCSSCRSILCFKSVVCPTSVSALENIFIRVHGQTTTISHCIIYGKYNRMIYFSVRFRYTTIIHRVQIPTM
jgi:hypothetical protein